MAFRRERNLREVYEDRFPPDRAGPYPRGGQGERRPPFGRPDEEFGRGFEYDNSRFYPNGAPRNYHGEDQRGYHGDGHHNFPNEHRGGPPGRRQEDFPYYRGPREEPHGGRQMDFRPSNRPGPPPNARVQGSYPGPRSMPGPDAGDDTLIQAIMNLDRGEERENVRRKAPFPPVRERSPARRDIPPSPHSRSGSSISSRSYSPERSKAHPFPPQQGKSLDSLPSLSAFPMENLHWRDPPDTPTVDCAKGYEEPFGPGRAPDKERPPGPSVSASRDGSPHSSVSATKEDITSVEVPTEEVPAPVDEASSVMDDFQERRAQAIAAKAREIEKVYRQDCETFGMVVKMLVAKEPSLEKHLQNPLKENLIEIRERCLEDLQHFIAELDEVVRQPEPAV
ncbi:periphilin-1 isoform X1 [Danio aesculapii]|uniref:periphilin-1 isoform X1 n=1 Tax=Danio aesculapii TaxID=1142201 RepID=UPI0024BFFD04|nr:periphilin-1 isoform X1 [Danio aesculapii]XP_056311771.1 periphilin-1 isoform X1 [Danio aesculapii]XP_056311772.1 periphilin-1 isoform X1 [Danio aesculapii]XP_056311773.1 periphilin-1 isoform X1 [Danio aesculapii]XP_056311774.1 periphilin-1 isoform X1 [Danio aesculapii]XP_056311776.1 periphilin-1 isoform X1 [Danio aesculapii]